MEKILKAGILVLLIVAMALFWPIGYFREEAENRSGDYDMAVMDGLPIGASVTQNFYAERRRLDRLGFVITYDEEKPRSGEFLIEVLDGEEVLYSAHYPYAYAPDFMYCDVEVELKLQKGNRYQYRLTNLSIEENFPCVVCSTSPKMHAINNCGLFLDGRQMPGEALTRYTWSVFMSWEKIITYWAMLGILAMTAVELTGVWYEKWMGRKSLKEEKSHKNV